MQPQMPQMTPQMVIQQATEQLRVITKRQEALKKTLINVTSSVSNFTQFNNNPSLVNISTLAAGLLALAQSQIHGLELELEFVTDNIRMLTASLERAKSPIQLPLPFAKS